MTHENDLDGIQAEKKRHFTPRWFMDLLNARLSLGDTFWLGAVGVTLIFSPALFIFGYTLPLIFFPMSGNLLLNILLGVITVYYAVLTTAVFRTAVRTPDVGGWRWVGVAIVFLQTLNLAFQTYLGF